MSRSAHPAMVALCLPVALASLAAPARAQEPGKAITVSGWTVFHARDQAGGFANCTAIRQYADGSYLGASLDGRGTVVLTLRAPGSGFTPKQLQQGAYRFGAGRPNPAQAYAADPDTLSLVLPASADGLKGFADVSSVEIQLGDRTFAKSFDSSDKAAAAVDACVRNATGGKRQ